jgi:hypothetical protein
LEDVLIDEGVSVNIITKNFITKLGLPKPKPIPYHLRMADKSMTKLLEIIKNLRIHVHGIPYVTTFLFLVWWILVIICCWEYLGLDMQRLHMIWVTMSLLFKVMEKSEQYQLIRNWEQKLGGPKYLFVMTC